VSGAQLVAISTQYRERISANIQKSLKDITEHIFNHSKVHFSSQFLVFRQICYYFNLQLLSLSWQNILDCL